ncbi:MAG TPA: shikimate kinase [Chlamydiales bacterium]|nr:shikimate kinase [Chlamydiales bacterium]
MSVNLILFGFKGCGKTYYGKRLAEKLRCRFIDTDELLGKPPKEIVASVGEEGFRAMEREAVRGLKGVENAVIAVGGGTVLEAENVEVLRELGQMVYLDTPVEVLRKRMMLGDWPSFLSGEDSFWQMIRERTVIYESIDARRVCTENLDETGVLAALRSIVLLDGI